MCRIIAVNLTDIDLNLLHVLHTVLAEGSATRAAARLHVTQSAVSNSLARLRRLLGDKLVVRSAGRLVPTPRASALRPLLAGGLERFQAAIAGAESAGLAHTRRRFTLACTDFVALVLVPRLMAAFKERLPHAALRVVSVDYAIAGNGLATGEVDLLVGLPPVLPPGCFSEPAFTDQMACIVRRDHPTVRDRLTLDSFTRLGHVEVALFGLSTGVDEALARINRTRNVALSISHFGVAPFVVLQTDLVATIPRRLAHVFAASYPLRILAAPVSLPAPSLRQIWHVRSVEDPGTTLLRRLVKDAARREHRPRRASIGKGARRASAPQLK
jgi:DNA-binding transcriptional LysR family regulator